MEYINAMHNLNNHSKIYIQNSNKTFPFLKFYITYYLYKKINYI